MDAPDMTPYKTMGILGGMIGPMVAAEAVTPCRNLGPVAFLFHGRNQHHPCTGAVCDARTGHARHDHVGHHCGVGQAAADVAYHAHGEPYQALGDATGVHQVPGQNEKWDGHEGKAID